MQINKGKLVPFSEEDREALREYHHNQVVRVTVKGTRKQRSIRQLRLYWACCQTVADNTDDKQWRNKDSVDFQCRVATHFVDPALIAVRTDGTVQFSYRSISFANLKHIEANHYFTRAFEVMAAKLGVSVEKLVSNAQ